MKALFLSFQSISQNFPKRPLSRFPSANSTSSSQETSSKSATKTRCLISLLRGAETCRICKCGWHVNWKIHRLLSDWGPRRGGVVCNLRSFRCRVSGRERHRVLKSEGGHEFGGVMRYLKSRQMNTIALQKISLTTNLTPSTSLVMAGARPSALASRTGACSSWASQEWRPPAQLGHGGVERWKIVGGSWSPLQRPNAERLKHHAQLQIGKWKRRFLSFH